jgi:RNA polymerase sigma-70 factor (ECF subfamily)
MEHGEDVQVGPGGAGPFDTWYRAAWPRLVAAVALDVRDLHAAEDAVAGAMAKAYARWDDGSITRPDAWVYRVAVNDGRKQRGPSHQAAAITVGDEPTCDIEGDPDLWHAVSDLPPQQRRAVALRYLCDMTQDRVATELGVAPGTVAALLHQARARLRTMNGVEP